MTKTILFAGVLAVLTAASAACHDDDEHEHDHTDPASTPYPSCRAITDACHYLDVGEGPIHECHDLGHEATSDGPCAARKDECLRTCSPSDAAAGD